MIHLVKEGVATTGELDAALSCGPGLRWALMGPFLTFHLSGTTGMEHLLRDWYGPDSQPSNSRLQPPKMDDELIGLMASGTEAQAAERSAVEMERMRDEFLVGVLKLRSEIETRYGFSQGRFL